jgi:H+/gluconate symporter-like permease
LCFLYLQAQAKKSKRKGEHFTFPVGYDESQIHVDRSQLPSAGKSFVPLIVLIVIIIVGSNVKPGGTPINSTMLTVVAMLVATVVCWLIFLPRYKGVKYTKEITEGLGGGISAIGGLAAVVAFGTVVQTTPAFQAICQWVLSLNMGTYWKGVFSTAVIAGITGSSSGGLRIMFGAMSDYFLSSGCNLSVLHRLVSIAAGSLDSLPHSSGLFLMLSYMGLTHKEAYIHGFWTTVIIPLVVFIVATLIVTLAGI